MITIGLAIAFCNMYAWNWFLDSRTLTAAISWLLSTPLAFIGISLAVMAIEQMYHQQTRNGYDSKTEDAR